MGDLKSSFWIKVKGLLFLFLGAFSGGLILLDNPQAKTAVLLCLCIWSFARSYYFAFYVIEKYVDGEFRYAGLIDFAAYLASPAGWKKKKGLPGEGQALRK